MSHLFLLTALPSKDCNLPCLSMAFWASSCRLMRLWGAGRLFFCKTFQSIGRYVRSGQGIATRSKDATFGAPGLTTRNKCIATSNKCHASSNKCLTSSNKKLLGAPGIATRNKDAITRGTPGRTTRSSLHGISFYEVSIHSLLEVKRCAKTTCWKVLVEYLRFGEWMESPHVDSPHAPWRLLLKRCGLRARNPLSCPQGRTADAPAPVNRKASAAQRWGKPDSLVASLLLIAMPDALVTSSNGLQPTSDGLQHTSFLFLGSF